MNTQLALLLGHLSPGLVLVGLTGLFWTMASGFVSPHSLGRLPFVLFGAILGAFAGQLVAVEWGFRPTYGDFQPICGTIGALALVVVVRRLTA